jgi:hypothetical protein
MARLQVSLQNLGAIDEDSDYTPTKSPLKGSKAAGKFNENAFLTPASGAGTSQGGSPYSPGTPYSASPGRSASNTRFSFSQNGSTTDFNDEQQDEDMMSSAMGDSPRDGR